MQKNLLLPDYLFETSWEVCNKIGGIHTVLTSKISSLKNISRHIFIGPDLMKEDEHNQEFIEDKNSMKTWRRIIQSEGIGVRIGRWNVEGKPIAILVNFSQLISRKDEIFKKYWELFKLDSLSGGWGYVESTLFGYAAGRVIESYVKFNCTSKDNVTAHFHEWMSGGGILYLRDQMPRVASVFTTHATVVGRCIAGNNLPLYDKMNEYSADNISNDFHVRSMHSMEKLAALEADSFTTVSEITAKECEAFLGRTPDVITPNGFSVKADSAGYKGEGRKKMLEVAENLLGFAPNKDALIIGTSGRYEFKNKGIDVLISALGEINKSKSASKEILAFIFVPAGQHGPSRELLQNMHSQVKTPLANRFTTHNLSDSFSDKVLNAIQAAGLKNEQNDNVKIIFVPSYLNTNDGIFNMDYYELLADLDLSLFPSYYEPWGYTPLESVAYSVPTVTTTLAGFGLWTASEFVGEHPSVYLIDRTDSNTEAVIKAVVERINLQCTFTKDKVQEIKKNAVTIAASATWENFIKYYNEAYDIASKKANDRKAENTFIMEENSPHIVNLPREGSQNWHQIIVRSSLPKTLHPLDELSRNIWWSWNSDAVALFKSIDKALWLKSEYNPILMLDMISLERLNELEKDKDFVNKMEEIHKKFTDYMSEKSDIKKCMNVAYFSMEYGLHSSLKIYSGGLGILAGDYLKEASDKGVNIVGVGLLYRYGYFKQKLSSAGDQVAEYEVQKFDKVPVTPVRDKDGNWMMIEIAFPGRMINAKIWRTDVGRTELYLLDTDVENNLPEDRAVTYHLYGGDWENRLKQEILLGVGGIRTLEKLGINADVYHCNEGHAAMIGLERIHLLMKKRNLSFDEAKEVVRSSSLFTTHTPVPAGHDAFDENMMRKYISHYPERFQVSWDRIVGLGRMNPADNNEKFSMSCLATNLSQEMNGVSWLHGKVSRDMFQWMFPGYLPEELYIGYVTNGVHYPTWTANRWKELYNKSFGEGFSKHHYDKSCFGNIHDVPNEKLWEIRNVLRTKLVNHVKSWVSAKNDINYYSPRETVGIKETLNENKLTIGFARRFATYKRAHLLFKNLDQLDELVNHPTRPVQFVFAGKAHPADKAGQDLIKMIVEMSKKPQFLGKILFLENYDMELASKMVRGVDIWLNTPTRPLEASGTSGEKAVMNGVMHFSVLDGWWVEGYKPQTGWALPMENTYENNDFQNELDAESIYSIIENEIAPLYYKRNENNIPDEWLKWVKNSIEKVASNFTTNRMMQDYEDRYYNKLNARHKEMCANDFELARDITVWKHKVLREWESISVVSVLMPDMEKEPILLGKEYEGEVVLNIGFLSPKDIGVEIILAEQNNGEKHIVMQSQFDAVEHNGTEVVYKQKLRPKMSGSFSAAVRIYAKNGKLPHRQDFCLVKWV